MSIINTFLRKAALSIGIAASISAVAYAGHINEIDINAPLLSSSRTTFMQEGGGKISYQVISSLESTIQSVCMVCPTLQ
jgi:hypothetical protein